MPRTLLDPSKLDTVYVLWVMTLLFWLASRAARDPTHGVNERPLTLPVSATRLSSAQLVTSKSMPSKV